ncbi:DISARM system phospholipase D-like protein DrmC [Planktothrix agardhii 1033]|nr:DISARM system phospholipase D-like protein DrmC [Planktothrix agardhii 1033]
MSFFHRLSRPALINLAAALESKRLVAPFFPPNLTTYVPLEIAVNVTVELEHLISTGMTENHIAYLLRLLAEERAFSQSVSDRVDLVWTGREIPGTESRDTAIVVRELFATAQYSVLIASYAIDRGKKAQKLFQILAERMDAQPHLQVKLFLNVQRPYKSRISDTDLLKEFAQEFRNNIWPGLRLPEVFYDPRSLFPTRESRACLHAKCVVVDEERLFITSANFTEAAHERNIEAGVLLVDRVAAKAMQKQFERLVEKGFFQKITI